MKKLHSLVLLLALAASSHADVLVYKGTGKVRKSTGVSYPSLSSIYLVVDPAQSLASTILLYRDGPDRFYFVGPPADVRHTTADVAQGKSVSLISIANASETDNNTFDHTLTYFRGTNSTLTIGTSGIASTINFPKLFGGGALSIGATSGTGRFLEVKVGLAFQRNRTIAANNANLTIQQVVNGITAELEAKGYQVP